MSYTFAGRAPDRLGVGRGLTLSMIWWSLANMATALARGPFSLGIFRNLLVIGEGGAWPAFAKAVAMRVPPEARTLAIGIYNSGPAAARGDRLAFGRVAHSVGGMESGVCSNWSARFGVGRGFSDLPPFPSRNGLRGFGTARERSSLERAALLPADLGRFLLAILRRPAAVLLRFLDSRVSGARKRT